MKQFAILWVGNIQDFRDEFLPELPRYCKCGAVLPPRRYVCDKCKKQRNKHAWTWRKKAQAARNE